jgi:hypothetical protein
LQGLQGEDNIPKQHGFFRFSAAGRLDSFGCNAFKAKAIFRKSVQIVSAHRQISCKRVIFYNVPQENNVFSGIEIAKQRSCAQGSWCIPIVVPSFAARQCIRREKSKGNIYSH